MALVSVKARGSSSTACHTPSRPHPSPTASRNGLTTLKLQVPEPSKFVKMEEASSSSTPSSSFDDDEGKRSRRNHIVGPDGQHHTQGEAARLGLIIRTACESCRNRKLKCSGTLPQDGGCERCNSDAIQCLYSARAPIGRPKKRKSDGELLDHGLHNSPQANKRKAKAKQNMPLASSHEASSSSVETADSQTIPTNTFACQEPLPQNIQSPMNMTFDTSTSGGTSSMQHNRAPPASSPWTFQFSAPSMTPSVTMPAAVSGLVDTKLPSLDDLSIAAFLQSLDTLEISPEELFQQQQQGQPAADGRNGAPNTVSPSALSTYGKDSLPTSMEEWTSGSAILQPGLSFAVPADFSWWDLGIIGADVAESSNASKAATPLLGQVPLIDSSSSAFPGQRAHSSAYDFSGGSQAVVVPSQPGRSPNSPSRKKLPNQDWPRGVTAGMGQGHLQQTAAALEGGLGWSTFTIPAEDVTSKPNINGDATKPAQCCSNTPLQTKAEPAIATCCSSKLKKSDSMSHISDSTKTPPPLNPSTPGDCCSGKTKAGNFSPTSLSASQSSQVEKKPSVQHEHPSKVHCVPNPSGKGCTCLCDMSVALLSVKQVLRETDPSKQQRQNGSRAEMLSKPDSSFASNTIQLTLTASQAITAQCACSTDCPTCQSDPSTEISASLLVSTALQIYARAVRILREGFASSAAHASGGYSSSSAATAFFGGLDVTIGSYKPSSANAKKIALFAIKLELKDLRKALGKVSRMAQDFNTHSVESTQGSAIDFQDRFKSMNPIDQLVIFKLYRQLTELLKTVEGLEDVA